jgi:hypothetical protein
MRGSRVMWSPDSPADEGMRTRPNAGNPEARNVFTTNYSYSQVIASGKPLVILHTLKLRFVKRRDLYIIN